MKPSEILIAAKAKIADEATWTQGEFRRDTKGNGWCNFEDACSFCALGAVQAVTDFYKWDMNNVGPSVVLNYLIDAVPEEFKIEVFRGTYGYVSQYNDKHTHKDVMNLYDKAIKAALEDGQ